MAGYCGKECDMGIEKCSFWFSKFITTVSVFSTECIENYLEKFGIVGMNGLIPILLEILLCSARISEVESAKSLQYRELNIELLVGVRKLSKIFL